MGPRSRPGTPAVFVRFSGCNLACPWCDTDHSNFVGMTRDELEEAVRALLKGREGAIIIPQPDGTGHATFTIRKSNVFFGWLAGFGTRARIIAPTALAEEFREFLLDIAETYE